MKKIMIFLLLFAPKVYSADVVVNPITGFDTITRIAASELLVGITSQINGEAITLYVLPLNHPVTLQIINTLGINYGLFKNLLSKSALVDRNINIKKTESKLVIAIASNFSGVGYVEDASNYYVIKELRIIE